MGSSDFEFRCGAVKSSIVGYAVLEFRDDLEEVRIFDKARRRQTYDVQDLDRKLLHFDIKGRVFSTNSFLQGGIDSVLDVKEGCSSWE